MEPPLYLWWSGDRHDSNRCQQDRHYLCFFQKEEQNERDIEENVGEKLRERGRKEFAVKEKTEGGQKCWRGLDASVQDDRH